MAIVLDGKSLSQSMEKKLAKRVSIIKDKIGKNPILATVLVGNDPASATYIKMKVNACKRIGMESIKIELPKETTTSELLDKIDKLNVNTEVNGIILQHPVPEQINERQCFNAINIEKDVDGVTCLGFGNMSMGESAYGSCTPIGIMRLLKHYDIEITGKHAVIVGRSPILGKPMAMMLLNENATVTICHSKTKNLTNHVKQADLLVGAVGIPKFIKSDWINENSVVVDAGYHPENCGDIDLDHIKDKCFAYTPVPGGVGPMTIACLLRNTTISFKNHLKK